MKSENSKPLKGNHFLRRFNFNWRRRIFCVKRNLCMTKLASLKKCRSYAKIFFPMPFWAFSGTKNSSNCVTFEKTKFSFECARMNWERNREAFEALKLFNGSVFCIFERNFMPKVRFDKNFTHMWRPSFILEMWMWAPSCFSARANRKKGSLMELTCQSTSLNYLYPGAINLR